MIRMKSFWIIACLLLFYVMTAFATPSAFKFQWTSNGLGAPYWSPLTYDCNDVNSDTLRDGTVIRVFRTANLFAPVNIASDTVLPVGIDGGAGQIWPTNEFVFNSEIILLHDGCFFNTEYLNFLGDSPSGFAIYLQIGCWEGQTWHCSYYSHRMVPALGNPVEVVLGSPSFNLFGDPTWTCYDGGVCPEPEEVIPPLAMTGFEATDDECSFIRLTWDPIHPDSAASQNIDSLVIKRGTSTEIAWLPWTATSYNYAAPETDFEYRFLIQARANINGSTALSEPDTAWGIQQSFPSGLPSITSASNNLCGTVKVKFTHSSNTQNADSVALLRNGVVVAKKAIIIPARADSIYHVNAPSGQAWYSLAHWNSECGTNIPQDSLQGEALNPPAQVQNVVASDDDCVHPTYVSITWTDVASETRYTIYRDGDSLGTRNANVTSYNDFTGAAGQPYQYSVRAYNNCGYGAMSDSNNGTLPILPPPPSGIQASNDMCDFVRITWNDESTIETGFAVIRTSPLPEVTFYTGPNVEVYDDVTAEPLVTYTYKVAGANACGIGTPGSADTGVRQRKPNPVTNLSAGTSTCAYARINWSQTGITNEQGFKIFRDAVEIDTANVNATSYNDSTAVPGVPYDYTVVAYSVCGDTLSPAAVSASRLPMPATPLGFTATDDECGFVACGWGAVSGVTGYTVHREDGARTEETFAVHPDSSSYTDDTALAGVVYTYWVTATNSCGTSGGSNTDDGAIQPLPGATEVVWDSAGCDAVFLCWNTATDVTSYLVLQNGVSIDEVFAPDTCYSFDPGDTLEYDYSIAGNNACGSGDTSAVVTLAKRGLPGLPSSLGASFNVCGNVTVSWGDDAVDQDGFYIFMNFAAVDTVGPDATEWIDTTITPGETRSYAVNVFNACGVVGLGEVGGSRQALPDSVEDVVATDDICAQVTITWTDPNGTEDGFKIVRDDLLSRAVDTVAILNDPDATTYDDMTAQSGHWYTYTVYGFSECGMSVASAADSGVVLPLPDAITGFTAVEECSLIVFNWDVSEFADSYRIYQDLVTLIGSTSDTFFAWDDLGQHNWHVIPANACGAGVSSDTLNRTAFTAPEAIDDLLANDDGGARTQIDNCDHVTLTWTDPVNADTVFIFRDDVEIDYVLSGIETYIDEMLTPADYEYYVMSSNECGDSEESNHVNATVYPPATVPQNVVASDTSCSAVYIFWDASTGTFDQYVIYADSVEIHRVDAGITEYLHSAVPGVIADYQVSCYDDACGESEYSAEAMGVRLEGPEPPTDVAASDTLCDMITLTWTAATGTFSEYRIYRDDVLVKTVDAAFTTADDDTISAPGTYTYTVTAWSAECGETIDSDPDDGTMLAPMGQVINLTASVDDCDGVLLGWVGFHDADAYYVYRDGTRIDTVYTNEAFDDGVINGETHSYTVSAVNRCNEGLESEAAEGMSKDFPAAILNLTATSTLCDSICLSWDDVEGETKYYIYREATLYDSTVADDIDYCDTDVIAGTTYNYVVRAKNECGEGDPSESIPGVGVASLAQPTVNPPTASCNDVCLTWVDIEGETGYQLYYSLNGSDFFELATLAADVVTYCDTEIGAGECREYTVAGINVCGVGAESDPIEGCRLAVPIIVPNVTASTDVCDSVLISWEDVGTETSYNVFRNSEMIADDIPANTTSYYDNAAEPNVTYAYTVSGSNDCGSGLESSEASGMAADIPAQVLNVVATADQCSLVTVTWDDLTTETGYEIYSGSDPFTLLGTVAVDVTTFDAVGFVGADNFSVVATNQCGSGLRSELAAGEGLDVPPVVEGLTYELNCGVVTLTWNFSVTADSYRVYRREEGGVEWDSVATTHLISHSDTPPDAGTWEYVILAFNECGEAIAYSGSVSVEVIPALAQVMNLTATTDECSCVTLTWDDVENETWYEIFREGSLIAATYIENNTDTVICDLAASSSYQVRAMNDCDTGPFSNAAIGSFDTVPPVVTGVSASEDNCEHITVIWDPVTVEPIEWYTIYCDGDSVGFVLSTADEEFVHVVAPGSHVYYVRAYNHCGYSDPSATDEGTRYELLESPSDATASTDRCDGIEINFTPVEGATSYTIFRVAFPITGITADDLPYLDVPPAPGNYNYTVAAVNICGQATPGAQVTGTLLEAPGTPGDFTASDDLCNQIDFTWTVPTGAVDGYLIYCADEVDPVADISDGTQTSYSLTELGAVTCDYTIIAYSNGVECDPSDPSAAATGISHDVPGAPLNLGTPLTSVCDSVLLTWDAAEGEVTNYVVYRDDLALEPIGMTDPDVLSYWDSQIDDPNDHQYWVVAENSCGDSVAGPVTASILPLMAFISDLPEMAGCSVMVNITVSHCEGVTVDSVYAHIAAVDTFIGEFDGTTTDYSFPMPDLGEDPINDIQLMVLSYRGSRIDTIYSDPIDYEGCTATDYSDLLIPKEFYLAQNYPNPFNPETTIEFGVPHLAQVRIEIFDVLGRRVATPVSSYLEPGVHQIMWSCDGCASGMYIVRMVSESKVFHNKMLMLK